MEPATEIPTDRRRLRLGKTPASLGAALVIVVIAAAVAIAWSSQPGRSLRPHEVMLLYVGADDCAPCRAWRSGDGAAFLASAEVSRLSYREIRPPHLADVLKDDYWPEEIRGYRNRIRRSDGVPLWLVVVDGEVAEQEFGTVAWHESVLPKVRSYLR